MPTLNFTIFKNLVKLAFNQRRKTLRNALKSLNFSLPADLANKRAEEVAITTYVQICQNISSLESK
ncbi:MAG: 16S rRNA (adenine(1518)-N(6)/adenine(1519)-N(6))-dimethyltransferase, partial [Bacteroidia bacterium]|nr:16S rRNA (adenine(1518)-N(6)/adenine(1519)-N(6))-dimethyltransferase [Bacteroidia bacterium]MDW8157588.1 16S rRNA (adenine(1518)-N(6)/adenine(1519)-N(6))-dimethyltransferase [Bacteroidia bacterium]